MKASYARWMESLHGETWREERAQRQADMERGVFETESAAGSRAGSRAVTPLPEPSAAVAQLELLASADVVGRAGSQSPILYQPEGINLGGAPQKYALTPRAEAETPVLFSDSSPDRILLDPGVDEVLRGYEESRTESADEDWNDRMASLMASVMAAGHDDKDELEFITRVQEKMLEYKEWYASWVTQYADSHVGERIPLIKTWALETLLELRIARDETCKTLVKMHPDYHPLQA